MSNEANTLFDTYERVLICPWPDQEGNKIQRPNSDLFNILPTKLNTHLRTLL